MKRLAGVFAALCSACTPSHLDSIVGAAGEQLCDLGPLVAEGGVAAGAREYVLVVAPLFSFLFA